MLSDRSPASDRRINRCRRKGDTTKRTPLNTFVQPTPPPRRGRRCGSQPEAGARRPTEHSLPHAPSAEPVVPGKVRLRPRNLDTERGRNETFGERRNETIAGSILRTMKRLTLCLALLVACHPHEEKAKTPADYDASIQKWRSDRLARLTDRKSK